MNMNMKTGGGGINSYLSDTVSTVFDSVYTVGVNMSSNVELFAANGVDIPARMAENLESEENGSLASFMESVCGGLEKYQAGEKIMTDDRAPVELLGMRAIDAMIFDEAEYYKDIFRKYGFKGLISSLS